MDLKICSLELAVTSLTRLHAGILDRSPGQAPHSVGRHLKQLRHQEYL
jgi:hypothetical protein